MEKILQVLTQVDVMNNTSPWVVFAIFWKPNYQLVIYLVTLHKPQHYMNHKHYMNQYKHIKIIIPVSLQAAFITEININLEQQQQHSYYLQQQQSYYLIHNNLIHNTAADEFLQSSIFSRKRWMLSSNLSTLIRISEPRLM
jgi:hypothetical protein